MPTQNLGAEEINEIVDYLSENAIAETAQH